MESKHCFIEFEIKSDEKFYALKQIFELIKDAKNRQEPKGDKFWVDFFPKYALENFFFWIQMCSHYIKQQQKANLSGTFTH